MEIQFVKLTRSLNLDFSELGRLGFGWYYLLFTLLSDVLFMKLPSLSFELSHLNFAY